MGMSSTILTGGRGVTDEAETGRTLLGGLQWKNLIILKKD